MDLKIRLDEDVVEIPLDVQSPTLKEPSVASDEQLRPAPVVRPWRLNYYQPYFEVDSVTVLSRLVKTVKPTLEGEFFGGAQPDLYAPFWIITTLILIVGFAGSIESSVYSGTWTGTISKLSVATGLLYGILGLVPLASYYLLKRSGSTVDYATMLSIYGYSFFIYVPAMVLCFFPVWGLQIALMCVATVWSMAILVKNYWNEIVKVFSEKKYIVLCIMGSGHIGFLLTCILYFFDVDD